MVRRRRGARLAPVSRGDETFVLIEKNPQQITAICLAVLTVIAVAAVFYVGRAFMLPVAVAFVFSVVLAPMSGALEWLKLPRALSSILALLLATGIVIVAFFMIAEPAARWLDDAPQTIQRAERQIRKLQEPLKPVTDLSHEVDGLQIMPGAAPKARTVVVQGPELTQSLLASAQVIAVQAALVFVLTYFFLLTREDLRLKMIAFQPKLRDRVRTARAFRDVEKRVGGYLLTFSIINVGVGVAVGLACWQLGLPEPAMWGGIAAILNYIPFLGPAVTIVLLGLAGLSTYDTLIEAAWPVLAYWGINFLESNLVTPTVMSRRMTLNPLAIVLSVSFWTWIWGPVGGLVSLPLLIMLKVVCDHTPAFRVVGALIGAPITRTAKFERSWLFGKRKPVEPDEPEPVAKMAERPGATPPPAEKTDEPPAAPAFAE